MIGGYCDRGEHLANVVKVTVGGRLLCQELLVGVQHHVQVELLLQQLQAVMAKRFHRARALDAQHPVNENIIKILFSQLAAHQFPEGFITTGNKSYSEEAYSHIMHTSILSITICQVALLCCDAFCSITLLVTQGSARLCMSEKKSKELPGGGKRG